MSSYWNLKRRLELDQWLNAQFEIDVRREFSKLHDLASGWIEDPDEWYEQEVARMKERAPA
jgi:hypothetical protein